MFILTGGERSVFIPILDCEDVNLIDVFFNRRALLDLEQLSEEKF